MPPIKLNGPALYTVVIANVKGELIAICSIGEVDKNLSMVIDVRPGYGPDEITPMLLTVREAFAGQLISATNHGVPVNPTTMEPIQ